jgi:RHS repeat-associated protein
VAFCVQLSQGTCTPAGLTQYVYDGLGQRVQKVTSSATVTYLYDAFGNLAAEYGGTPSAYGTQYVTGDHLTSTRLVMPGTASQVASGTGIERHDYYPFGYEPAYGTGTDWRTAAMGYGPSTIRQKFTGQERDSESNLDFFQARYYSGPQGRFASVDPGNAGASLMDPQSWNAYSYVSNGPMMYTDPDGLGFLSNLENFAINLGLDFLTAGQVNLGGLAQVGGGGASGGMGGLGGGVYGGGASGGLIFNFGDGESISAFDLPGQWFAGFIDLFFNGKPSGGARMVYAVGADLTGGALLSKGAECARTALALRGARFAQKGASVAFSAGGKFAGQTVEEVAQALKSGALKASDVPVQYVVKDGTAILLNTRSAMALTLGGIGRASWSITDVTTELGANLRLAGQLGRNPGAPFSVAGLGGSCTVSLGK